MNTKRNIKLYRWSCDTNKKGQSGNGGNGKNPFKAGFYYSQKFTANQSIGWKFNFNQWINW